MQLMGWGSSLLNSLSMLNNGLIYGLIELMNFWRKLDNDLKKINADIRGDGRVRMNIRLNCLENSKK